MEEKRKYIRIDLCIEVAYEILPMHQGIFSAKSKNISEGGMCFLTYSIIPSGSILRLKFCIPDEARTIIECLARVIWQKEIDKGFLTGIEFRDKDINLQMKLGVFVLKFLKKIETNQDSQSLIIEPPETKSS